MTWLTTLAVVGLCACAAPPDIAPLTQEIEARPSRFSASLADTGFGRAVAQSVYDSPRIARSGAELEEAWAGLLAARAGYYPEISLSAQMPVNGGNWTPGISLTQLVFDAGAIRARTAAAEARLLGRSAGQMDAGAQAALEAVEAWAGVVTARRILAANEATLAVLERISEQIAQRTEAGAGSSADALTARSRLENQRVAVAVKAADVTRAEAIYTEIFGKKPGANIALPPRAPALPSNSVEASPTLLEAKAEKLATEARLAEAQASLIAPLSLGVSKSEGSDAVAEVSSPAAFAPGGGRQARVAAAVASVAVREADVAATRREISRRVAVLSAERAAAEQRLIAARGAAKANKETVIAARDQFLIRRRTLLELLDTERDALSAEQQVIQAEHDTAVLGYALLASTGDLLDVLGISLITRRLSTDEAPKKDETAG